MNADDNCSVANVWHRSCNRTPSTFATGVPSSRVYADQLAGNPTASKAARSKFL